MYVPSFESSEIEKQGIQVMKSLKDLNHLRS